MKKTPPNASGANPAGIVAIIVGGVLLMAATPINQGFLQSDLNAGGYSVTNAATVSATNITAQSITLNGVNETNWPSGGSSSFATNSAFATNAGTATNAGYADQSGHSTNSDVATMANYAGQSGHATNADIATAAAYASYAGFATNATAAVYANTSGYSTNSGFSTNAGSSVYANTSAYSTNSGFATNAGSATYAAASGYSTNSGFATNSTTAGTVTLGGSGTFTGTFTGIGTGTWNGLFINAIGPGLSLTTGTLTASGGSGSVTSIAVSAPLVGNPSTITSTGTISLNYDSTLSVTTGTLGLNLATANSWSAQQNFTSGIGLGIGGASILQGNATPGTQTMPAGSGTLLDAGGFFNGTLAATGSLIGTFTGTGSGTWMGAVTGTATNASNVPLSGVTNGGLFYPENYGAVHNCKFLNDVSSTAGSATITSASASFTSGDVGKVWAQYTGTTTSITCTLISASATLTTASTTGLVPGMFVVGAGTFANGKIPSGITISSVVNSGTLVLTGTVTGAGTQTVYFTPPYIKTTIATVVNSGTATLSSSTGLVSSTGQYAAYFTDDTTAINSAIAAAGAVQGKVTLGPYAYGCAGALQDTADRNSVLELPTSSTGSSTISSITIEGTSGTFGVYNGDFSGTALGIANNAQLGTILFSPTIGSGTNPSLLSGNGSFGSSGFTTSNVTLFMNHVTLRTMANSQLGALGELNAGGCSLDEVAVDTFYPGTGAQQAPLAYLTVGLAMPNVQNNQISVANRVLSLGYGIGIIGSDHLKIINSVFARDNIGIELSGGKESLTNVHMVVNCQNVIGGVGAASSVYASGLEVADLTGPFVTTGASDFSESTAGSLSGWVSGTQTGGGLFTSSCTTLNFNNLDAEAHYVMENFTNLGYSFVSANQINNADPEDDFFFSQLPSSGAAISKIGIDATHSALIAYVNSTNTLTTAAAVGVASGKNVYVYRDGDLVVPGTTSVSDNGTDTFQVLGTGSFTSTIKGGAGIVVTGTISSAVLSSGGMIKSTSGSLTLATAGTDYAAALTVQTGTLVGGTGTKTVPAGSHPWVQDNAASLTNVGSLVVTVSGTSAVITSTNVLDTSPYTLYNAGSQ